MVDNVQQKKYHYASGAVATDRKPLETAKLVDGTTLVVTHKTLTHVYGEVVPSGVNPGEVPHMDHTPTTVYVPVARVKTWDTVLTAVNPASRRTWVRKL